jgi:hypothetical protein
MIGQLHDCVGSRLGYSPATGLLPWTETRAAFVRIDRYFELSPAQHLEVRQDIERLDVG